MVGDSNDENNLPHKLLLTNTEVSKIRKAFANGSSENIRLSKTQFSKMVQLGGFLSRLLEPLLKTNLSVMKNVLKPLAKYILIPLGLTAAALATGTAIQEKIFGSGMKTLILWNEDMDDITKIIKSLEESDLLIKGICETIQNETKQKDGFPGTGKGVKRPNSSNITGRGVMRAG